MKIVITGSVSSGKSSLIEKLDELGKQIPEVARNFFTFLEEHKVDLSDDRNFIQNTIELKQIENWWNNPFGGIFDRSLVDEIAYRNYYGLPISDLVLSNCQKYRYDVVFFLPFWDEIYVNDAVRLETKTEALILEKLLREAYERVGYQIIEVPKVSVEDRVIFIKDTLTKIYRNKVLTRDEK